MDAPIVIIAIIVYVVGFIFLSAVIRNSVRRGVETVLYKRGKDGLRSANPWVVSIA